MDFVTKKFHKELVDRHLQLFCLQFGIHDQDCVKVVTSRRYNGSTFIRHREWKINHMKLVHEEIPFECLTVKCNSRHTKKYYQIYEENMINTIRITSKRIHIKYATYFCISQER